MIPLVINPGGELQPRPLKEVIRIIRVRSGYGVYTLEERREAKRRNTRAYEARVRHTPEYKARKAERDKRRYARINADPEVKAAHNARSAELKRIRRERMKKERPVPMGGDGNHPEHKYGRYPPHDHLGGNPAPDDTKINCRKLY